MTGGQHYNFRERGEKKKTNVITVGIQDTLAHKAPKLVSQNANHSRALHSEVQSTRQSN